MYADATCGANVARFAFLSPAARRFYTDWDQMARFAVGALRIEAGKNPYDRELSNLIGELSTRSDAFRVMWGSQDVCVFNQSTKRLNHPHVGELELDQETMRLPDESGLSVVVYSAPAGTAAEDGLKLLASDRPRMDTRPLGACPTRSLVRPLRRRRTGRTSRSTRETTVAVRESSRSFRQHPGLCPGRRWREGRVGVHEASRSPMWLCGLQSRGRCRVLGPRTMRPSNR